MLSVRNGEYKEQMIFEKPILIRVKLMPKSYTFFLNFILNIIKIIISSTNGE